MYCVSGYVDCNNMLCSASKTTNGMCAKGRSSWKTGNLIRMNHSNLYYILSLSITCPHHAFRFLVQVSQFHASKGDVFFHPIHPQCWWLGVHKVVSEGSTGGGSGDYPLLFNVLVPPVADRYNIHYHDVAQAWIEPSHGDVNGWKHASETHTHRKEKEHPWVTSSTNSRFCRLFHLSHSTRKQPFSNACSHKWPIRPITGCRDYKRAHNTL